MTGRHLKTTTRARERLAAALGIEPLAPDARGRPRPIGPHVRDAIIRALGFDASSDRAATDGLRRLAAERARAHPRAPRPGACVSVDAKIGRGRRAFGLWGHLYSLRAAGDRGIGDFATLRAAVAFAAERGADFVGLNPLHAIRATNTECSPYSPISRLYRSAIYLDVAAIPELDGTPPRRAMRASGPSLRVDYDRVRIAKEAAVRAAFDVFRARDLCCGGRGTARGRAFDRYVREQGDALRDHAAFVAIGRVHGGDVRRWPAPLRDARSAAVREFIARRARDVERERFVQFELDRQLGAIQIDACRAGLAFGLYGDLAIGSIENGSDVWANRDLFVTGVSLGAPPDPFATDGQVWDLPPLDPVRSGATGHAWFRRLLAASFRHVGLLRIDHVIGLVRQWWVPQGASGRDGAFVRMPAAELFACVAAESRAADACVVGEDLGTVPQGLAARMRRARMLSSSVLLFEPDARRFRRDSLATVNTHDLPPLAGWLAGDDLRVRRKLGMIGSDAALRRATRERASHIEAWSDRLRAERLFDADATSDVAAMIDAAHRQLAKSKARLIALAFDDLAQETEALNVPTATPKRHPVWKRRARKAIPELASDPRVTKSLETVRRARS